MNEQYYKVEAIFVPGKGWLGLVNGMVVLNAKPEASYWQFAHDAVVFAASDILAAGAIQRGADTL